MYDRILVPTDGNEPATAALEHAIELATDVGASIDLLHVIAGASNSGTGQEVLEKAKRPLEGTEVTTRTELRSGEPIEEILAYATEADVDATVLGTMGRQGVRRLLLGSVAEGVVREAEVPVVVVPGGEEVTTVYPYERIVVGIDGSEHASAALGRAIDVATRSGATLHLVSVVELPSVQTDPMTELPLEELQSAAERAVEAGAERARSGGVEKVVTDVEVGSPDRVVRDYADEAGADLVVVGTHGRSGVDRLLLGSVSERVLRTATSPVLTVGPWATEASTADESE